MDRWVGKVAVVTGASAGIGASIVEKLVKKGIKVVGLARRKENIEQISSKLQGEKGKLYAVKCDISDPEDVVRAFKWVKDNIGPAHILINNAGISKETNLRDGDFVKWKQVFDTNVLGLCITTREALRQMKEYNIDGHIIHINSTLGHVHPAHTDLNVYPASKHAVTALTESLRRELNEQNSKIKITSFSPGRVLTQFGFEEEINEEQLHKKLRDVPALVPEEVADSVLYVLGTPPNVLIRELMIQAVGQVA